MTDSPDVEPASDDATEPRHHVPMDSDTGALEAGDGDDSGIADDETTRFGGPDDASDEQPMLVVDATLPIPEVTVEPVPESAASEPVSELQSAYDCLEIRTPLEELRTFARARLETLVRLGEADRAELTRAALDEGLNALREVMGAVRKEAQ